MKKEGKLKMVPALTVAAVVIVLLVGAVTLTDRLWPGAIDKFTGNTLSQVSSGATVSTLSGSVDISSCPDDGDTSLIVDVQNYLNTTGAETFDVTAYLTSTESNNRVTLSDTTSPSATTINCGEKYMLEIVRADGSDGDNSEIKTILSGSEAEIENGVLMFTPTRSNYNLRAGVSQHGVLNFAAYDEDASGDVMCNGDDSCTDYELDGVSFMSSTNGTALVVATDGYIDITMKARAIYGDNDFTDYYGLIAVEAPYATWQEPSLKLNGATLSNVKGKGVLTAEEETALSGYEYVYKFEESILDGNDGAVLSFYMQAKSGVNPSVDPEIDWLSAGRFLSIDGVTTKVGAFDDTSSNTAIFAVQDTTLDIS